MNSKKIKIVLSIVVIGLLLVGLYIFLGFNRKPTELILEPSVVAGEKISKNQIAGQSTEGRDIEIYSFGLEKNLDQNLGVANFASIEDKRQKSTGENTVDLLFVGGIHGGYEYNSVMLAYEMIDYLKANLNQIPDNINLHIIPVLNPDGLFEITGAEGRFNQSDVLTNPDPVGLGRFNANNVDLNRNFDCKWSPESTWRNEPVQTGQAPFSEAEAKVLRDVVYNLDPDAVIFWHSKANTVYASECENGVLPETSQIMKLYAGAATYNYVEVFDAYPITGDAEGWLASINIPAITVELETRTETEFNRNLSGIKALINYYK